MTVPRVLHRVWLKQSADDVIPTEFESYWERFGELHPTWTLRTWDDPEELFGFMRCREQYDRQTNHAGRSDIARYEIIAEHGGIYVDTDVEPLRAFDELLANHRAFAGREGKQLICPTVIGAPAHHAAMTAVLDLLPRWELRHRGQSPNIQTGPHLFTAAWHRRRDVRIMPQSTFYPVGWWERGRLNGDYPPESLSVHHWSQRWDPKAKAAIDAKQR